MDKLASLPFFSSKPWFQNSNSIWLSSHFSLKRNLKSHFFPDKLDAEFIKKLSEMLSQALLTTTHFKQNIAFPAQDLTPQQKQLLYEYYLSPKAFAQYRAGERLLLDPKGYSYVTLNMEDHLHIHQIETHENLEEAWNHLLKVECHLSKNLEFAFSEKFGFITSDPTQSGTGLKVQTLLHLPALIHLNLLEDKLQKVNRHFSDIDGFGGSVEEAYGDLIMISNRQCLGISEETLLKNIRRMTLEFIVAEQAAREKLDDRSRTLLKDKIGKAFGVLRHASKLSLEEALKHLSLCKLGLELGWLQGISLEDLNTLLFTVRKGYLKFNFPKIAQEDHDKTRSHYLHKKVDLMELVA